MTIKTLPQATPRDVASHGVELSVQCRRQAVRVAMQQIVDGAPHLGLATLIRSAHKCAHLDNRPLSPYRVYERAEHLVEQMIHDEFQDFLRLP